MAARTARTMALIASVVIVCGGRRADADMLYSTSFEASEGYTVGAITGQNGYITVYGNGMGQVSTTTPAGGSQALLIPGTDMVDDGAGDGLSYARYRPDTGVFQVDPSVTPAVLFQADVRLNGVLTPPPISGDLISANFSIVNNSATNPFIAELYVSSDGDVWADNYSGGYLFGTSATTGAYYRLGLLLNFQSLTAQAYVDGSYIGTMPLPSDAGTTGGVRFDLGMFGVNGQDFGAYSAQFDNVLVASVPEPGLFVHLSILAAVGMARGLRLVLGRRPERDDAATAGVGGDGVGSER